MFIDEIILHVKAGKGGDGVVLWRHEKGKEYSGPSGGNGGRGGDVYIKAVRDIGLLARYRNIKEFSAGNGENGMKNSRTGKDGKTIEIDLPIGSKVTNKSSGREYYLEIEGQTILILKGGNGGLGNENFKSSTNTRPKEFTYGRDGEEADLLIELELVVDVGIIGMPNAGKSSLLNSLTNAKAKVGSFPFTTLEPNLGDFFGYILADIPGLIEGAAQGKGLGHKFLKHIKRTKMVLHCVSGENEDVVGAWRIVRDELGKFGTDILDKKEIIVLTKTDILTAEEIEFKTSALKKCNVDTFSVSIFDESSINEFGSYLSSVMSK